jgi:putative aldouronate transport system permease protein
MALPVIAFYLFIHYVPMYGAVIAFKNFTPGKGILGSPWVGFKNFNNFFSSVFFFRIIKNTLFISLTNILFGFPAPIILALLLNEIRNRLFKRAVQTVSYLPHFVSIVVVCGLIIDFTSLNGIINDLAAFFGITKQTFLLNPDMFVGVYVSSEIWQTVGWGSIVYIAAIASIEQEMYEAAIIDGAGRFMQAIYITLPSLMPVITVMLILRMGSVMNVGFEKIILLQNNANLATSDVISTFVYRRGLLNFDFSYSSAVGLFNSVVNFTILLSANWLSAKFRGTSLF